MFNNKKARAAAYFVVQIMSTIPEVERAHDCLRRIAETYPLADDRSAIHFEVIGELAKEPDCAPLTAFCEAMLERVYVIPAGTPRGLV